MSKRRRIQPTDEWQQLSLLIDFPEQPTCEVLRPVVLFGYSPGVRAKETGVAQRTLYRHAARSAKEGMASLFAPSEEKHRSLAGAVRDLIRTLKAEYPLFRANEIATICGIRLDHRPSPHTVKRILADEPVAAYTVQYAPGGTHLVEVTEPRLFETPHQSPQPFLCEHADRDWLKMVRVPACAPRRRHTPFAVQTRLLTDDDLRCDPGVQHPTT